MPAHPAATRKPRARSQARIDVILDAARTLLAAEGVAGLSIYSVAKRAQIPASSVYHFFASVPALLQALTADVHAAFRAAIEAPIEHDSLKQWRDLSSVVEQRMLSIYEHDAVARQLILTQHGLTEVTQADRQHDLELGDLMLAVFNRHFEVPTLPTDMDVFALALELSDRVYARSVHQHGRITPRMAEEGIRVFDAYVGLYLPQYLPKRASSRASPLPHVDV
ncbi:TetR/AcrR family transcriptional regulator [Pseudomonas poae]|uniref:DNA-binding transcriptional regulator, AcrR family n=1 Tax=Pseudomonas poae TaxID=200451 RepID=A0ABY0RQA9_9PSED|nr:TetR/AcrR family transcriptional regulator [Pseudomonas poae]KRP53841.1 TetR family transcriptional regulator [Pseudomonas poae]SDO36928.1 DNA-binding transcriptional regulator, AcrR family [Pseudomonas poae]